MFDEAYPVHAFVAANKMIQLTVNGAKQCFSGSPEMPLLWYLREILADGMEVWLRGRTLRRG
jgi:hypothetical protein